MPELLSIVIPCFNESEVIDETYRQLVAEMERICAVHSLRYELVFVDDGSSDDTRARLQRLHERHPPGAGEVVVLSLSRNFGHQIALTAGLRAARGDAAVAIDADLQDPPHVIEEMVRRWKAGVDVAYGVRTSREGESAFKLATARAFYVLVRRLTNVDIPMDAGDFRLLSRRALDAFNDMPERSRFIRGMVPWLGLRQEPVPYARAARFAGTTKYPFTKMLRLAFDGITSFSTAPLKLTYLLGFGVALLCALYMAYVLVEKLFLGAPERGWSSLMAAILFLGAVQLISVGLLGEYVGRIYDEVKRRPLYVIDERESRLASAASLTTVSTCRPGDRVAR